jgi:A/G-specific adenine glycosylase
MHRNNLTNYTSGVQGALLSWFNRHRREMPWRRTRDPYAIWVSEIMLQQTQVATVRPYFERFMKRFPSVQSLADASLEEVLKLWEGLGYYSRARNLHRAARQIMDDSGGELPKTAQALLRLPGIGPYTAGAIASIAFGLDEPVLDGNVTRVLCRLFRIRRNPKETKVQQQLWWLARKLVPRKKAGLFNQALMDLGATICTPRQPHCDVCPLSAAPRIHAARPAGRRAGPSSARSVAPADLSRRMLTGPRTARLGARRNSPHTLQGVTLGNGCQAKAHGEQDTLPVRARRKPIPHHDVAAGIIWRGGRVLIDQRKPEGLLGGLWEFPGGKRQAGEMLEAALVREVREELGIRIAVLRPLLAVRHAYTHFRITLHAFECRYVSGQPRALGCAAWKWVKPGELDRYAFPKANHAIIAALRART